MTNTDKRDALDRIDHVDGVLNYLADRNEKPISQSARHECWS